MTRRLLGIALATLVAAPTVASAAVREPGTSGSPATATREMEAEGAISAVDLKSSPPTIQVSSAGQTKTLRVPSGSIIRGESGKTAALDQFRVGQRVRVKYAMQNGREVATAIELAEENTNRPAGTDLRS